jgi:streptomycin 6-kinase
LPALLDACARRWSLALQPPFELSYNYVCPAVRADGTEMVLKVGVVNPELLTEIAALQLYAGRGCAQLLDADPDCWNDCDQERRCSNSKMTNKPLPSPLK